MASIAPAVLTEHETSTDDASRVWYYFESRSAFVATAYWHRWEHREGSAPRYTAYQALAAECDDIDELRAWCARQVEAGAGSWRIHATWPVDGAKHRVRGELAQRWENAFREGWDAPKDDPAAERVEQEG